MTDINKDTVKRVATLAGLIIDDAELASVTSELTAIESFISAIQTVDTTGVQPTAQVTGLNHVTRADKIQDYQVTPEQLVKQAPESEGTSIKVPSVK